MPITALFTGARTRAKELTTAVVGKSEMAVPKRRLLVLSGLLDPTCEVCNHFDLKGGQEAMAQFEAFMGATRSLTPEQMGRVDDAGRGDADWDVKGPVLPASNPVTRWDDYGACGLQNIGIHKGASCKDYA